jgi:ribosomal protein L11 methyltransferase
VLLLVLTVPAGEAELAADALWALGVAAIEEREGDDAGVAELRTSLGDDPDVVARAVQALPDRWQWRVVQQNPSLIDTWRAHAQVSWIERDLVVAPAWLPFTAPADTVVVRIEPGATFGLGDHPTTVLSLRGLRAALPPGGTVLDVGCGSGVLAVTAAVLGAMSATAIDISPAAPAVATANALANGVADRVHTSNAPLAAIEGTFDVVVANILAPALLSLADGLVDAVAPGGALVISGILAAHHDHVVAALAPLRPVERRTQAGWTAITLRS